MEIELLIRDLKRIRLPGDDDCWARPGSWDCICEGCHCCYVQEQTVSCAWKREHTHRLRLIEANTSGMTCVRGRAG